MVSYFTLVSPGEMKTPVLLFTKSDEQMSYMNQTISLCEFGCVMKRT